jgi:uncharacterized membrane protein YhiD involved in acid resistance
LRYIFGYDQVTVSTKEIIMLIKVNILPTLKERIEMKKQQQILSEEWQNQVDEMRNYGEQIDKARKDKKEELEKKLNESNND